MQNIYSIKNPQIVRFADFFVFKLTLKTNQIKEYNIFITSKSS
ncbi:protein of unknown function [Tepidibacter aestuarii]|nr:protein of unknown function [Tepidibacter aestuarii]